MNKKNLLVNLLFIIAVLIIIITGWGLCKKEKKSTTLLYPKILETDPKKGSDSARVTIIEFGDFQCQYCQTMSEIFNQVKQEYGENVRLIWKDFPLTSIHDQASGAAQAARCAQMQGKFWEMHDLLFQNQSKLSATLYLSLAEQLKLNTDSFSECLSSQETIGLINQNMAEGNQLGVKGTPYFYVNQTIENEVVYLEDLKKIIDSEL